MLRAKLRLCETGLQMDEKRVWIGQETVVVIAAAVIAVTTWVVSQWMCRRRSQGQQDERRARMRQFVRELHEAERNG